MKSILKITLICILSVTTLFAQQADDFNGLHLDLGYGQKMMKSDFYNQLGTLKQVKTFQPVSNIGVGIFYPLMISRKINFTNQIFYKHIIPQNITIADSVHGKISGFNFSMSLVGINLPQRSKNFVIPISLGFSTGRLKTYKNDLIKQKNPFFAPKISVAPRVKVGKIAISLLLDYEFDISKPGWRGMLSSKDNMINIDNLRQTGFCAFLCIGIPITK